MKVSSRDVELSAGRVHYLEGGEGLPVVFLHGWPTSSSLWEPVLDRIDGIHAIAPDLMGFGQSEKPDVPYDLEFHVHVLDELVAALVPPGASVGIVVHDLGGPIGLTWACRHRRRIARLVLLNTVVYPESSWTISAFVVASRTPVVRSILTTPWSLRHAIELGFYDRGRLSETVVRSIQAPFDHPSARHGLLRSIQALDPQGLAEVAADLSRIAAPVQLIYAANDNLIPDVGETMARVARELPQAHVAPVSSCGHFLQLERPQEVAEHLTQFLASGT